MRPFRATLPAPGDHIYGDQGGLAVWLLVRAELAMGGKLVPRYLVALDPPFLIRRRSPHSPTFTNIDPLHRLSRFPSFVSSAMLHPPQASAWSESEGVMLAPWTGPTDLRRRAKRIEEMDLGLARCRALVNPKLREQVGERG